MIPFEGAQLVLQTQIERFEEHGEEQVDRLRVVQCVENEEAIDSRRHHYVSDCGLNLVVVPILYLVLVPRFRLVHFYLEVFYHVITQPTIVHIRDHFDLLKNIVAHRSRCLKALRLRQLVNDLVANEVGLFWPQLPVYDRLRYKQKSFLQICFQLFNCPESVAI